MGLASHPVRSLKNWLLRCSEGTTPCYRGFDLPKCTLKYIECCGFRGPYRILCSGVFMSGEARDVQKPTELGRLYMDGLGIRIWEKGVAIGRSWLGRFARKVCQKSLPGSNPPPKVGTDPLNHLRKGGSWRCRVIVLTGSPTGATRSTRSLVLLFWSTWFSLWWPSFYE